MSKIALCGLFPNEITEVLNLDSNFRGNQIFKWLSKGVTSFDEMTNLSLSLREDLKKKAEIRSTSINTKLTDPDGTVKLQILLPDSLCIETVLLTDAENRKTACVSSQVGCAMKCRFCQTGALGFARNLTPAEIVEQFYFLEQETGPLDNIVFMGMGEPMLNLSSVRKAITILTSKSGRNLSPRRITISTSGVISGIYDLADNGPAVRLAVSLTTADNNLREELMPVTKTNPLSDLSKAIKYFVNKTGKRCTLEAALLGDVNTGYDSAKNLAEFAKDLSVHINLIPWNPVATLPYKEPTLKECDDFLKMLEKMGLSVTKRTKRGRKIGGACGQLGITGLKKS